MISTSKQARKPSKPVVTKPVAQAKSKMQYATKIDGANVEVLHAFRRRYVVRINGIEKGYITAGDVMNAVGRVESVKNLKALQEMLHTLH